VAAFITGDNAEEARLRAARVEGIPWKKWGPYLSERQWGTVREDDGELGTPWESFTHDQARSRAYRWGEDGLAGISDQEQRLCFAIALWNGKDPMIKERLFGLTNSEGNHGEDVKEYYFYLDNTPTHSYMKYLYKYPQKAYPYDELVRTNRARTRRDGEYELIDTGLFANDRYFDVLVEYAKASPDEILIKLSIANRGARRASLHVLPTLWFRNTWSRSAGAPSPLLRSLDAPGASVIEAAHPDLGLRYLVCQGDVPLLFTENETNTERLFGTPNPTPYVKDGINDYLVHGRLDAVNPDQRGTKAAAHYILEVEPGETEVIRMRFGTLAGRANAKAFDQVMALRRHEADEFYRAITPPSIGEDAARVMRQALAGMLWSKQYYAFDAGRWLTERGVDVPSYNGRTVRNKDWFHMVNDDVICTPDKWEYPCFAAWDLAFHTASLAMVDPDFAKNQLDLMLRELYMHPSGQIPAYEWNFSDVSPPVHAWASLFLYQTEKQLRGEGDVAFLERIFHKLTLNFTWWVNRKDRFGKNVFDGGLLGLDNIGVFDRSAPLPTGGFLEQADATAWMAMFCQNMLEIAAELASHNKVYEDLALKFVDHFFWIALRMNRADRGDVGFWDEADGFYYDVLRLPDGSASPLKVRSIVGLLPLCATTVVEPYQRERLPRIVEHARWRIAKMPELAASIHATGTDHPGVGGRGILALVNEDKLRRILTRMLDENEFLSPYGIRSLSRHHADHPYVFPVHGEEFRVDYLPAESDSGMFGGNSNWRGPIWFPINALVIRALLQFYLYYGEGFRVECPTGSGRLMNLFEVSRELSHRLTKIFLLDAHGRRPVFGGNEKFQGDPHWSDCLLFYEHFHGDTGAGLGASHQTGWTGLAARIIQMFGYLDPASYLKGGKRSGLVFRGTTRRRVPKEKEK
jgi:hypothetical protein